MRQTISHLTFLYDTNYKLFLILQRKKIKEMAKKYGFHDVKYAGKWKDCKVYESIFTDGEVHYIGYRIVAHYKGTEPYSMILS